MPNFLQELKPSDWIKLGGVVVAGTLFYADVQSSLKAHDKINAEQNAKITEVEKRIADALVRQGAVTEKMAETLSLMNGSLKAIEAHTVQMDKRIERIERKL